MDKIIAFVFGVLVGVVLYSVAIAEFYINPKLDECQLNLPRTESCVIVAAPKETKP